jgi:hypothetical protein
MALPWMSSMARRRDGRVPVIRRGNHDGIHVAREQFAVIRKSFRPARRARQTRFRGGHLVLVHVAERGHVHVAVENFLQPAAALATEADETHV